MIAYLARRSWGRLALLPVIFAAGAFSWGTYVTGNLPADKRSYWKNFWGWLSPAMEPHWTLLGDVDHPERKSTFHEVKNIGAEYCRAWPQTAYKAGSFLVACVIALLVITIILTSYY